MPQKKTLQKVGIITKRSVKEHKKCLNKLLLYLRKKKKTILLDKNAAALFRGKEGSKKSELLKKVDLVIVLGGDGTLLKTARRLTRHKDLIFGINFGNLGFLTECTPEKMFECLDTVFAGKYYTDRRSILRVTVYRDSKKLETHLALNDAVINQGSFARLIKMDCELDGRKLVRFRADGIIISTPTGSTAHSLSAGGPIVHPYIEGLVVTPICPSSLSITVETQRRDEWANIGLTIDGQDLMALQYGDKIKIRRSKRYIYLARTRHRYYRMLRSKLNWGDV